MVIIRRDNQNKIIVCHSVVFEFRKLRATETFFKSLSRLYFYCSIYLADRQQDTIVLSFKLLEMGFNYVVEKQEKQKICFGSGKTRDISIKSGMNLFMRYNTRENFSNIGPGTYNDTESFKFIKSKIFSHKGYGGLTRAVRASHTEDYPAPNEYNISQNSFTNIKETKYPFLSTVKRNIFNVNTNPGPSVYQMATPINRRAMFEHDFGRSVKMRLPVEIKCCKRNLDICDICNQKPNGDYWHLNNRKYLCRPCMTVERRKSAKYKNEKLKNYRKIRDCSWIHSHEGTDAKIWLMHPNAIQKWTQKEAYMCSYIND